MEPVFLSSLVDHLTGFEKVYALTMIKHLFFSYGVIDKIGIEKNAMKVMGPYNPAETLARLIEKLGKGR